MPKYIPDNRQRRMINQWKNVNEIFSLQWGLIYGPFFDSITIVASNENWELKLVCLLTLFWKWANEKWCRHEYARGKIVSKVTDDKWAELREVIRNRSLYVRCRISRHQLIGSIHYWSTFLTWIMKMDINLQSEACQIVMWWILSIIENISWITLFPPNNVDWSIIYYYFYFQKFNTFRKIKNIFIGIH